MNILPFESNYIEIWGIKGKNPEKTLADKQNVNAKKYQLIVYRCKQTINTNRSLDKEQNYNDCRYSHLFLRLFSEDLVIFLRVAED